MEFNYEKIQNPSPFPRNTQYLRVVSYLSNVLNVIPAVFLVGFDELIEIPFSPVKEAFGKKSVAFLQLFLSHSFGFVYFHLNRRKKYKQDYYY